MPVSKSFPFCSNTNDTILYFCSLKNFCCERNVYTMFFRPKLAAPYLRRGPKPGPKLAAAYFSRKEIVRLYYNVRDLFKPRPI